jgi:hypothetical protein
MTGIILAIRCTVVVVVVVVVVHHCWVLLLQLPMLATLPRP